MSNFEHAGNFHLNATFAFAISDIVTKHENKNKEEKTNYTCFVIDKTSPNNKPAPTFVCNLNLQDQDNNHKQSISNNNNREFSYIAITDTKTRENIEKATFQNEASLVIMLSNFSLFCARYDGILHSDQICEKLPYLEPFFKELDKTRELSGRISVYPDEIGKAYFDTLAYLGLTQEQNSKPETINKPLPMDNKSKYLSQLDNAHVKEMLRGYLEIIEDRKNVVDYSMEYGLLSRSNESSKFIIPTPHDEHTIELSDFNASASFGTFDSEPLLKLAHTTNMYLLFGVEYLADLEAHEKAPFLRELEEVDQFISKVKNNAYAKENEEAHFEKINPLEDYPTDCLPFE